MEPPPVLPYPDEPLPVRAFGFVQFNGLCNELLNRQSPDRDNDTTDFVRFALAGRYILFDELRRAYVHPTLTLPPVLDVPLTLTRDFDSLIGISNDLPFSVPISIFPVPRFRDTLTSDNHLTWRMVDPVSCLFVILLSPLGSYPHIFRELNNPRILAFIAYPTFALPKYTNVRRQ